MAFKTKTLGKISLFLGRDVDWSNIEMASFEHEDFGQDVALINFSSGTTGFPKAIPSTHNMIWDRANSNKKENV